MKQIIYAFITLISLRCAAQPVLTTTSQIGYVAPIAVVSAATLPMVPIATTGANASWDASGLVKDAATPIINYTVSAPAGTTYAADYTNANWHFTDPALLAILGNTYYNLSADSFVLWGAHVTGSAYEIYDNPEMDLAFPFAYNQIVNNTYSKTNYTAAGGISSYQTGNVTLTYDGYGTLILPNGTYNNVVRIKKVRTNDLGPTLTSYYWYNSVNGANLLMYEEKAGGTPNAAFNTNVVSRVADLQNNYQVQISTDLENNMIVINSASNIDRVKVYSLTGQLILSASNINAAHWHQQLQSAKGMYLVQVECNGETIKGKVNF
ncbi:MAG: T9SS type A sorting domain-containing protein [Chitinophagaceae bacterium]|nr:T9SS type A sorting domain-containing protein [Chitinophagaceae bacterium]